MSVVREPKVVILGMMASMPVPGVVWQTLHYLIGFERLGYRAYYVEAHGHTPSVLMESEADDPYARAADYIARTMRHFGLHDRWAYRAMHGDARPFGMSDPALSRLYRSADLIVNLHGGTEPQPEMYATGRLAYLETDPVELQIELHDGVSSTSEFLAPHSAFFTFAENLGGEDCTLPVCERYRFRATRQPVVLDLWGDLSAAPGGAFTTIGNWRQPVRRVSFEGETYSWTKDEQWRAFIDLPERTGQEFELALSSYTPENRAWLESRGWQVRHALDFGNDVDAYRDYIAASRGEFTVAKEQNVRFRTGWFSDRSATYLASGRPVITQDTGFARALPTGRGLFAVGDIEDAVEAIGRVNEDLTGQCRAATEIAREYFDAERVLGDLLDGMGLPRRVGRGIAAPAGDPRAPLTRASSVAALVPTSGARSGWRTAWTRSSARRIRPMRSS